MASIPQQRTGSGHHYIIRKAGVVIGFAQNLQINQEFGTEGAYVIGTPFPQEHATHRYTCKGQLTSLYLRSAPLEKLGVLAIGEEIVTFPLDDVEIIDQYGGSGRVLQGCTLESDGFAIRANAFVEQNVSFVALSQRSI